MESDLDVVHRDWPKDRRPQTFVDPQLAKIPRRVRRISLPATGVNGSTGIVLAKVPANAMWRWIAGRVVLVATGTVGTRNFVLRFRDQSGNVFLESPISNPAATQGGRLAFADNSTFGTVSIAGFLAGEMPSPNRPVPEGYDVFLLDQANIDVLDTASFESQVEEFAVPKGLSQGEIPMGLESGFLWDLAEPRKVA